MHFAIKSKNCDISIISISQAYTTILNKLRQSIMVSPNNTDHLLINKRTSDILTSANSAHAHIVRWHNFLFDREVISLQWIERRVAQDDVRILALVFERQQVFRADGVKGLVRLCYEARLCVFWRRDALWMLYAVIWRKENRDKRILSDRLSNIHRPSGIPRDHVNSFCRQII